jgi:hypothetical protein
MNSLLRHNLIDVLKKLIFHFYSAELSTRSCHVAISDTQTRQEDRFGFIIGLDFEFHTQRELDQAQCLNGILRQGPHPNATNV